MPPSDFDDSNPYRYLPSESDPPDNRAAAMTVSNLISFPFR